MAFLSNIWRLGKTFSGYLNDSWRQICWLNLAPPLVILLSMLLVKESPYWLVQTGNKVGFSWRNLKFKMREFLYFININVFMTLFLFFFSLSLSLTHTLSLSLTHTHSHSHTHTLSCSISLSLSLSLSLELLIILHQLNGKHIKAII